MPYQKTIYAVIITLLIALVSIASFAEAHEQRGGRRGPPQESIDACTALVAGDSCTFTGRRDDEITGTCRTPQKNELACVPANRDKKHGKNRSQPPTDANPESASEE